MVADKEFKPFYDEEFGKYIANYVRMINKNAKKAQDEELLKALNENLVKQMNGSFMKSTRNEYNHNQALAEFYDVCACVEIQLANEFGTNNYYALEKSDNEQARAMFQKFENWKNERNQDLVETTSTVEKFWKTNNPKILKSGKRVPLHSNNTAAIGFIDPLVAPAVGIFVGFVAILPALYIGFSMWETHSDKFKNLAVISLLGSIPLGILTSFGLHHIILKHNEKLPLHERMDLSGYAETWGYDSTSEMRKAIQDALSVYSEEEQKAIMDGLSLEYANLIATQNGYVDYADFLSQVSTVAEHKQFSDAQILSQIADIRTSTNDYLAQQYGQKNYAEMIQYLENHKILTGETEFHYRSGAGWSVYDYDSIEAKSIAEQLSNQDEYFAKLINSYKTDGISSYDVTVYPPEFQSVINQAVSGEYMLKGVFGQTDNLVLTNQTTRNQGLLLDLLDNYSDDTLIEYFELQNAGPNTEAISQSTEHGFDLHSAGFGNSGNDFDLSAVPFIGIGGVVLATGVKLAPYSLNKLKLAKANKKAELLAKIDEQKELDAERFKKLAEKNKNKDDEKSI